MLSNANFLILDEPTNHLDIVSKEILENALNSYTGTILYVSHDRYFINTTATRILELNNKKIINYIGNYDYYIEKREILSEAAGINASISGAEVPNTHDTSSKAEAKISWQQSKEEQARLRKLKNELKKTEENIARIEERIIAIDEESSLPEVCRDTAKLMELHNEKTSLSDELDTLYEKWEDLSENSVFIDKLTL